MSMAQTCQLDLKPDGYWLTYHLGDWVITFHPAEQKGRIVLAEMQIHATSDVVPEGGIPSRVARAVPLKQARDDAERLIIDAMGWSRDWAFDHGFDEILRDSGRGSRGGKSDEFILGFVELYLRALSDPDPTSGGVYDRMRAILLAQSGGMVDYYSTDSLERFVRDARTPERNLLSPAPPGRPGGTLTPKAKRIIGQRDEDRKLAKRRRTWVQMRHPETKGEARVTLAAFDYWHEFHGWEILTDKDGKVRASVPLTEAPVVIEP